MWPHGTGVEKPNLKFNHLKITKHSTVSKKLGSPVFNGLVGKLKLLHALVRKCVGLFFYFHQVYHRVFAGTGVLALCFLNLRG